MPCVNRRPAFGPAGLFRFILFLLFMAVGLLPVAAMAFDASGGKLDAAQVQHLLDEGNVFLLDVREPGEYGAGHADGAVNIPVKSLEARLGEIPMDRPVLIYCRTGKRAARAYSILTSKEARAVQPQGGSGVYYTDRNLSGS